MHVAQYYFLFYYCFADGHFVVIVELKQVVSTSIKLNKKYVRPLSEFHLS